MADCAELVAAEEKPSGLCSWCLASLPRTAYKHEIERQYEMLMNHAMLLTMEDFDFFERMDKYWTDIFTDIATNDVPRCDFCIDFSDRTGMPIKKKAGQPDPTAERRKAWRLPTLTPEERLALYYERRGGGGY